MGVKKKLVLIPSAFSHRVLGDIEHFIPYYKDVLDVYVITDQKYPGGYEIQDGVTYVGRKTRLAVYLQIAADYVIDAGTISGSSKIWPHQKRISVWHGIPYKSMFTDLAEGHIITALDYATPFDLMVSPSPWYTERFLRQSMLYKGDVLETCISRTDSLFPDENELALLRKKLGIPPKAKVLLYAPTYREEGKFRLPFSSRKLKQILGDDWIILVKLHYLNELVNASMVINVTDYPIPNHLLALADILVTDYSSILFDYSILGKPAILYQYDRDAYLSERNFMFDINEYVDDRTVVCNEELFYKRCVEVNDIGDNLQKIRAEFYPHQIKKSTECLVDQLALDTRENKTEEIIFLVNELNQIGGVHSFVLNLAREFKKRYETRIIVIGGKEFDSTKDGAYIFDREGLIDIKVSAENDLGYTRALLSSTNGYIIACQLGVHRQLQRFLKGKKSILMFHGDTKDVVKRHYYVQHLDVYNTGIAKNYRRLVLLTKGNFDVLSAALVDEIREKAMYIENSMDFSDARNLYAENGDFAFVSRLDPDKNPLEVIEIFSHKNINPKFRLHVYGDGSLKREMAQIIADKHLEDRIILHGYIEDKQEIYGNKQGVLLTSLSEGLPITILEATKFGIPVYAYNSFTACRDMVSETTGVLIPPENTDLFVEALNCGFNMDHFDNKVILATFSNDNAIAKWMNLFEELDKEVQAERENDISLLQTQARTSSKRKKHHKTKPMRTLKSAIQRLPLFQGNVRYAELSTQWRHFTGTLNKSDQPLVSIIMPYFNKRDTVTKAVRSIEKCGYDNYEILLVNDGSTDDPREILPRSPKLKYFYKENGGLGAARNFGIQHAHGKYVLFFDPDDTLYPGGLSKLVNFAEKHGLDLVAGKTQRYYVASGKEEVWYGSIYATTYINTKENRYRIIEDNIATAKLFALKSIKENNLEFPSGFYEDIIFMARAYALFDRIGIIKSRVQTWMVYGVQTSISSNHTIDSEVQRLANADEAFSIQTDLLRMYYTKKYINHQAIASIQGFKNYSEEDRLAIFDTLKKSMLMYREYILDKLIPLPSKKLLYQALLNDDYETFSLVARGYSARYFEFYDN